MSGQKLMRKWYLRSATKGMRLGANLTKQQMFEDLGQGFNKYQVTLQERDQVAAPGRILGQPGRGG